MLNPNGNILGLANIYASNNIVEPVDLWQRMIDELLKDKWLTSGDFNLVEMTEGFSTHALMWQ
jgi:hypothetical protein